MTESTEVLDIKAQMLADAEKQMTEVVSEGSSNTISTGGKTFSLGDLELGEELSVVIVGSVFENAYYDRPYNSDELSPPACFAIHEEKGEMKPHEDSPLPQAKSCDECPMNEWESAATGRGKACSNKRRIAMYAYDENGMNTDQLVQLRISPTGLKKYNAYVKGVVARLQRPVYGVATKISFDDKQTYPTLVFECIGDITDEDVGKAIKAKKEVALLLNQGYDCSEFEEYVPRTKKKSKMS